MYINNRPEKGRPIICQWCGQITEIIWVHGHGQCSICGTNIDECCRGEQCNNQSSSNSTSSKEINNE